MSTAAVDYIQRCGRLEPPTDAESITAAPSSRRLLRIRGIGRAAKAPTVIPPDVEWRAPTASLITGMYGYRMPVAFEVTGSAAGVSVALGTWSTRDLDASTASGRLHIVEAMARGIYPYVDAEAVVPDATRWPYVGIALGVPAPDGAGQADGSVAWDHVIRAMFGSSWRVTVLAMPVAEDAASLFRGSILNEVRAVEASMEAEGAPSPLGKKYTELLDKQLDSIASGMATGTWRAAVYLHGDQDSFARLAAVWRSAFSGPDSLPEPVRVHDLPNAAAFAAEWSMPLQAGRAGPAGYVRPFEFQTLLDSAQLAAYVHLPELEVPGYAIDVVSAFDSNQPTNPAGSDIALGRVLHQRRDTGVDYLIDLPSLTRHATVTGLTGAGKTNTIFSLLSRADEANVPFLVVEPAKTEYRALINHHRFGSRIRVFTAGKHFVGPLFLNPLEVPPGTGVSEHIDLIRAAFGAAFGMWTPLPQILERAMVAIYVDRGWDLTSNTNHRLAPGEHRTDAFPTLDDLIAKVNEIIPTLGYQPNVTADLRAALNTRLEALRSGGKGAMLDVSRSYPIEDLLAGPAVIELESLGDDGDKAFLTALLLIRLVEYRRTQGQSPDLKHLLVIEEAHRLFSGAPARTPEYEADPRGQAVEAFTNLLSEIRAYGQGVIIADQSPVRLAPDAIKNTNLKIAHRIVSRDDRDTLAAAMAMEEPQTKMLPTLGVGQAVVFATGNDAPHLVQIPEVKDPLSAVAPDDGAVAEHMRRHFDAAGFAALFRARAFCEQTCASPDACLAARRIVADGYVQWNVARTVLSTIEQQSALGRLWPDLVTMVLARAPKRIADDDIVRAFVGHAADWWANRRGSQESWSFADTQQIADALRSVLLSKVSAADTGAAERAYTAFRTKAHELHRRNRAPYPMCDQVCTQSPALCLYRSAAADLVQSGRFADAWRAADADDAATADLAPARTWNVLQDAAYELIEFPDAVMDEPLRAGVDESARRVCMCIEQQMLARDDRKVPRTSIRIATRVLAQAGFAPSGDHS